MQSEPGVKIVDARTQGEIDGQDLRGIKRAGLIKSSVPVSWEDTLDKPLLTFKPGRRHRKALSRQEGILPSDQVITYWDAHARLARPVSSSP